VTFRIRAALPADWEEWRDLRLAALEDTPGAFGNGILVLGALGLVGYGVVLLVATYVARRDKR